MVLLLAIALVLSPTDTETRRIQAHLARVEMELRAAGQRGLSATQRRWRANLIGELHRYWTRGRFPRNTFVDRRSPVFVDRDGTRCAVAELIAASGRLDLVARVAASRNTAYVAELASDAELVRWLDEHGFTAAEAARIQPTYGPDGGFATGDLCGADANCSSNLCIVTDGLYGYCSEPCEDGSCPRGPWNLPLECSDRDGEKLCLYPPPGPGHLGWPCEDDDVCQGICLHDQEEPTCTNFCSSEDDCPEGYSCDVRSDEAVCVADERDRGCASGGAAGGPTAALLALLLALKGRRRGRGR
jgi:hypothetical protein